MNTPDLVAHCCALAKFLHQPKREHFSEHGHHYLHQKWWADVLIHYDIVTEPGFEEDLTRSQALVLWYALIQTQLHRFEKVSS